MVFPADRTPSPTRRSTTRRQLRALAWLSASALAALSWTLLDAQQAEIDGRRLRSRADESAALSAAHRADLLAASTLFSGPSRRDAIASTADRSLASLASSRRSLLASSVTFLALSLGAQLLLARKTRRALHGPLLAATLLASALATSQLRASTSAEHSVHAERTRLLAMPEAALLSSWETDRGREPQAPARLLPASGLLASFALLWLGFWVRLREYER